MVPKEGLPGGKKRILFVDDEPHILEGLRNRLRRQRRKWEMTFVGGGHEALEMFQRQEFDVLVTDMRMPKMDGAQLLKNVQEKHPRVVRIVLSGYSELENALRAVAVAHQFLNKPCDAGELENVVDRACGLQTLIDDEGVRETVGKIETLPPLPRVYSQLMVALADDRISTQDVAQILKQDMAMCAKLLQIVNSAFFRLSRTIARIEEAVTYLGFNSIKQVALAVEVFGQDRDQASPEGVSLDALQKHSLVVAHIASQMFDEKFMREDAFAAALLHDIGKLLLVLEMPDHLSEVVTTMRTEGVPMHVAERQLTDVTHAEVGAYLLGLWGLPYPIVEAVANHHDPARVEQQGFDILAAIHTADALANEYMDPVVSKTLPGIDVLDAEYLETLGVGDKLDDWRELAKDEVNNLR